MCTTGMGQCADTSMACAISRQAWTSVALTDGHSCHRQCSRTERAISTYLSGNSHLGNSAVYLASRSCFAFAFFGGNFCSSAAVLTVLKSMSRSLMLVIALLPDFEGALLVKYVVISGRRSCPDYCVYVLSPALRTGCTASKLSHALSFRSASTFSAVDDAVIWQTDVKRTGVLVKC